MNPLLSIPDPGCICIEHLLDDEGRPLHCVCGDVERRLRAITKETILTSEQRNWMLEEIRSVEGWDDYQSDCPKELANSVLTAWLDYCRDKGVLQ